MRGDRGGGPAPQTVANGLHGWALAFRQDVERGAFDVGVGNVRASLPSGTVDGSLFHE